MRHAFISYVRDNHRLVDKLASDLSKNGIKVWLDRNDIKPGQYWKNAIRNAIEEGEFFIACFSSQYNKRNKTFMNSELSLAIEILNTISQDRIWFIPLLLSPCKIPDLDIGMHKKLKDINYIEIYKDWDNGIKSLLNVMKSNTKDIESLTPQDLFDVLWMQYKNEKNEDRKLRLLEKAVKNGDQRAFDEIRNMPVNSDILWVCKSNPIPEYIDVAIESLSNESNEVYYAMEYLQNAVKKIPHEIKPEHLVSCVTTADYLTVNGGFDDQHGGVSTISWFLAELSLANPTIKDTCIWIITRMLELDLGEHQIHSCIAALAHIDPNMQALKPWISYCIKRLGEEKPKLKKEDKDDSFFNTDAAEILDSLECLPISNNKIVISLTLPFLSSIDNLEFINALQVLIKYKAKLSKSKREPLLKHFKSLHNRYGIKNFSFEEAIYTLTQDD